MSWIRASQKALRPLLLDCTSRHWAPQLGCPRPNTTDFVALGRASIASRLQAESPIPLLHSSLIARPHMDITPSPQAEHRVKAKTSYSLLLGRR